MSDVMLFASGCPLEEVPLPPGFVITLDPAAGTADAGFEICPVDRVLELATEKEYFAVLQWSFTPERGEKVIEYLKNHLKNAEEVEFWHTWQDMDFGHRVRTADIPIGELTVEDVRELYELNVWKEPVTDFCFHITRGKR